MTTRPDPPPDEPTLRLVAGWLDLAWTHPRVARVAVALQATATALDEVLRNNQDQGHGRVCTTVKQGRVVQTSSEMTKVYG